MKLRDLIEHLQQKALHGDPDVEIAELVFDSRLVRPGALFVAIQGGDLDGHRYIPQAVRLGAAAIVSEHPAPDLELPLVVVPNSRKALALLAAAFYLHPAGELCVIGVTGTDGKTTTTNLIGSMLTAAGLAVGTLSTIKAEYAGEARETGLHTTTPNPVDVQRYLREMVDSGVRYAVLESTSHALDQDRVLGCEFDVAVVTNVAQEHLDYHRTYGQYLRAKGLLFGSLTQTLRKPGIPKASVLNLDDVSYGYLRQFSADNQIVYGIDTEADVMARNLDLRSGKTCFHAVTPAGAFNVQSPLPGRYNVSNLLAAIGVANALGLSTEAIQSGAANLGGLTGRWEHVETGEDFAVVIDFAHTPQALEQALKLGRAEAKARVIAVFGCAGLRDRFKRPLMGEIAGRLADIVVITAEDPRTEEISDITRQVAQGCERAGRQLDRDYFAIGDRGDAIAFAIDLAGPGDLVIIAGKGHERSLCIGETEIDWSEHEAVAKALARRHAARRQKGVVG